MSLGYLEALRNTRLDAIAALVDAGSGAGKLRIYNGARPATGGTVTTLLAELTFSATAFTAAAAGVLVGNLITDDSSADATGTATWFRIVDSDNNFVLDGSCGLVASDLNLNTVDIVAGVAVAVTQFDITHGNA